MSAKSVVQIILGAVNAQRSCNRSDLLAAVKKVRPTATDNEVDECIAHLVEDKYIRREGYGGYMPGAKGHRKS